MAEAADGTHETSANTKDRQGRKAARTEEATRSRGEAELPAVGRLSCAEVNRDFTLALRGLVSQPLLVCLHRVMARSGE
eukprot:3479470-Pleurochrysis_carterae.AAC.4